MSDLSERLRKMSRSINEFSPLSGLLREAAEAVEERDRLRVDGWCDACAGTGKPASGGECMCSGTGLASMAVTYLRVCLLETEAERDAAQKAMSYASEQAHQEWTRAQKAEAERDRLREIAGSLYRLGLSLRDDGHLEPQEWLLFALLMDGQAPHG